MAGLDSERPSYSSKNNKKIKKRLSDLLSSKSYAYDAGSDSVYRDYTSGYRERSARAAAEASYAGSSINHGDSYSARVSNASMHRYNARANEMVPQLAEMDFAKWQGNRQNQYNGMNALITKESTEYGRYRDDVAQYEKDRQLALQEAILAKQQAAAAAAAQAKADAAAQKEAEKAAKEAAKAAKAKGSGRSSGGSTATTTTPVTTATATTMPVTQRDYMPTRELNTNQTMYNQLMNKLNSGKTLTPYEQDWLKKIGGYESHREEIDAAKQQREQQQKELRKQLYGEIGSFDTYLKSVDKKRTGGTSDYDKELKAKQSELDAVYDDIQKEQENSGILGSSRYEEGTPEYEASLERQQANREKRNQIEDEMDQLQKEKIAVRVQNDMQLIESNSDLKKAVEQLPYYDEETGSGMRGMGATEAHLDAAKKSVSKSITELGYTEKQADRIVDSYIRNANERNNALAMQKAETFANEHPGWASLQSVGANIVGSGEGFNYGMNYLHNMVADPEDYVSYDRNNNLRQYRNVMQTERATVSDNLEKNVGAPAAFLYETGMSIADSLTQRYLLGEASTILMASGAASDAAASAAAKGLPEDQVAKTAFLSGLWEWAFETVELENLKSFEKLGEGAKAEKLIAILKQGLNETAGESATELLNIYSDYLVNGGASDFMQNVEKYKKENPEITDKEAIMKAIGDSSIQIAQAGLAGFLSGAASAGIESTGRGLYSGANRAISDVKQINATMSDQKSVQALVNEGAASDKESTAYKLSQKLQEKIDSGKKVNAVDVARQTKANESAIATESVVAADSYIGNDSGASKAIESAVRSGNITNAEAKAVLGNEKAIEVLSDMSGMDLSKGSSVDQVRVAANAAKGAQFDSDIARYAAKGITKAEVDMAKMRYEGDYVPTSNSSVEYNDKSYKLGGIVQKNGQLMATIADGDQLTEVPARSLSYQTPAIGALLDMSTRFDAAGAASFINNYDGSVTPEAYSRAFSLYYDAGRTGGSIDDITATISELIPEDLQRIAYLNGQNDAEQDLDKRETAVAGARREAAKNETKKNSAKVTATDSISSDRRKMAEAFAEIGGLNINYSRFSGKDKSANGFIRGNTINVNLDGSNPDIYVLGHEYMHDLKNTAPKQFDDYVNTMINGLKKNYGDRFDTEYERYRKRYNAFGQKLSDAEIFEEMAADSLQAFWSDPERFKEVVEKDKTFAGKILDFLNNFVEWLKDQLKFAGLTSDVAKMVSEDIKLYEDLAIKYSRMVDLGATAKIGDNDKRYDLNSMRNSTIDIAANIKAVNDQGVVYKFDINNFGKSSQSLGSMVRNFYDSFGNSAENPEIGEIIFDNNSIKDDIAHGVGRLKASAFLAAPKVIERGKVVNYSSNWKNRGYQSACVAAYVDVVNEDGDIEHAICGVVVTNMHKGVDKAYAHEIGIINTKGELLYKTGRNLSKPISGKSSPDVTTILQDIINSNSNIGQNASLLNITAPTRNRMYERDAEKIATLYSYVDDYSYMDDVQFDDSTVLSVAEKLKNGDYSILDMVQDSYDYADDYAANDEEADKIRDLAKEILDKYSDDAKTRMSSEEIAAGAKELTDNSEAVVKNSDSEVVADQSEGVTRYNIATWNNGGRETLVRQLDNMVNLPAADMMKISPATRDAIINEMDIIQKISQDMEGKYVNYSAWANAEVRRNKAGDPTLSVIVPNGEYELNIDFSTVCKKRKALDEVLNELVKRDKFSLVNLDEQGMFEVNQIIKKHGLEIACQCCFVDAKRYRISSWANSFADMWNDVVGSLATKGTDISEFNFSNAEGRNEKHTLGNELSKKQLDALNKAANKYRNGRDTDIKPIVRSMVELLTNNPEARHFINSGDLISSAGLEPIWAQLPELATIINTHQGTAKPKSSYAETQYINQIINNSGFTPEKAWAVGGVRVQSFSDYMGNMFFDYAQLISELAAKQLPAHSYTKELDYIRIFGKTGMKINMSLVPKVADVSPEMKHFMDTVMRTKRGNFRKKPTKNALKKVENQLLWAEFQRLRDRAGLDENGNYLWADETFRATDKANRDRDTLELADEWQNKEGYSQNIGTIAIGVSDAHILKMLGDKRIRMVIPYHKSGINHLVAAKGNIDLFQDYTNVQNTGYMKDGKRVKLEKDMEDFDWYEAINGGMTAKEAADAYLKFCKDHDYVPKFEQFKDNENYYKLLIDFASYDSNGNATPQQAVTMTFPEENLLRQYISESLEETQTTAQKRSSELNGILDEIEQKLSTDKRYSLDMSEDVVDYEDDTLNDDTYAADQVAQETADLLNGFEITETQIKAMYDKYVGKNNSSYSEAEFKDKLSNIAAYLNGNYRKNAKNILQTLQHISSKTMETAAESDDSFKKENEAVRKYLRSTTFVLDDTQTKDVIKTYGSVEALRKQLFGRAKITTAENYRKAHPGVTEQQIRQHNIDSYWDEMTSTFPEWFTAGNVDQIGELVDAVNAVYSKKLDNISEKYGHGVADEMARSMANNMLMDLMSAVNPVSSKDAEKFKRLRTLYGEKTKAYKDLLDKRYEERLAKLKEKYEGRNARTLEAMAAQKESYREREANRKQTAERTKYKNDARKIYDKLNKMLANPTDSAYIPVDMINGVIDVLQEINFDTGWRNPDGSVTKAYEKLDKIKKSYESLRAGESDYLRDDAGGTEFDGRIITMIEDMKTLFEGDKNISSLSGSEMKQLVEDLSYIYESIRNSTKLVGKEDAKRSYKLGEQIVKDLANSGRGLSKSDVAFLKKLGRGTEHYTFASMAPERVARMMVGYNDNSPLIELTQDLTRGEEKMHMISKEIDDILRPVMEGKQNAKELRRITGSKAEWLDYGFTDKNGKKVLITPAMRMSLFMHLQNKANVDHIEQGGIKIPNQQLYMDGKISEAYAEGTVIKGITEQTLKNIAQDMTEWEKEYCKAAAKVFDDYAKKKINETSLALNGYGKARVNHYMPISTDQDFIRKASEMLVRDMRIEGNGHLKSRQQGANNPIMLEDLTSALMREQNFVSRYAGLAIPLSNYNKVMNVSLFDFDENGDRISYTGSVKQSLNQEWGKNGSEYIERMLADLNGGREKSGSDLVSKALAATRGNMAGAVLTLNPSVTMKQAASYPTAAAVVGFRDLAAGAANVRNTAPGKLEELINKYTAEYYFRSKGNSTQELGDLATQNNIYTKAKAVPALGLIVNSIQEVDLLTTRAIWLACENNISRTTNLQKGSDSYYRKVAELYNRCIHETQPNYSVMQRPEILRTTNEVTKAMTMFMTQRLQNGGILMDSAMNLKAKTKAYKLDQSDANKSALSKAQNEFAHAVLSQMVSAAVLSAMTTASRVFLHKMNPYRDKDKELTWSSFWKQWFKDFASCLFGSFLFGSTSFGVLSAVIFGDKWYGMSDNLTSSVNGMIDASYEFMKIFKEAADGELEEDEMTSKLKSKGLDLALSVSQMLGIPLSNVVNIFEGMKLHAEDAMNGEFLSFNAGVERRASDMGKSLYEAMISGDAASVEKWSSRLADAGKDEKAISSYLKKSLKENEDILKAAEYQAANNYADYTDIVSQYMQMGFSKEDIIAAIGQAQKAADEAAGEVITSDVNMTEDLSDVEYDGSEADYVDAPEALGDGSTKSMYSVDMLKSALDSNNTAYAEQIKTDLYNAKYNSAIADGKTAEEAEDAANKAVKKAVKGLYKDELVDAFNNDNSYEIRRITDILGKYGVDSSDFKEIVGADIREQYKAANEAGNISEMKRLEAKAIDAGYDESDIRKLSGAKEEYIEAFESGNQSAIAAAEKKAKDVGYSDEQIMKWVGRTKINVVTDKVDSIIGTAKNGGNYSTDDLIAERDAYYKNYLEANPDKDEWDARKALLDELSNYYKYLYDGMSQEDRNRLDNVLRSYLYFGKTKSGRKSTRNINNWAGKSAEKSDAPEKEKKASAKYW